MRAATASDLLRLGVAAVRTRTWLFGWLLLAEACAALVALLPELVVLTRVFDAAQHASASSPAEALVFGFLEALLDPATWAVFGVGALLATAGGLLLRMTVQAGVLGSLAAAQVGGDPDQGFAQGILANPVGWLAAGALAQLLRLFAFLCGLGAVIAGMVYFKANPSPAAAFAMTIATFLVVILPFLGAALDIGFVRAVLLGESPLAALGGGLQLATRRYRALVPTWATFVFAEVVVSVALAALSASFQALPGADRLGLLLLGPRAMIWLAGVAALALLTLARLGSYAALVDIDAGRLTLPDLPRPPPRRRPSSPVVPAPVVEAAEVEAPAETIYEATEVVPDPREPVLEPPPPSDDEGSKPR